MFIKICANTNLADAQLAAELGADAVGFVFAPSQRQVTPAQVGEIARALPGAVEKIGVFASKSAGEIIGAVAVAGLTGVQLHGKMDVTLLRMLNAATEGRLRIVQTVAYEIAEPQREVADERFVAALEAALAEPGVSAVLLDTAKEGASGGLGVAFDWKHVAPLVEKSFARAEFVSGTRPRLIVAGGLRPGNVREAIAAFRPWGVDVASGVEAFPGRKDPNRLRDFIDEARNAGSSEGVVQN